MNTLMTSKPVGMAVNSDEGGILCRMITNKNVLNFSTLASQLQSFAKKGTWEHKLRQAEIERTEGSRWKENHQNDDDPPISHHISHFLPPEELAKFMQRQKVKVVGAILYVVLSKCLYVKQRVNNSYLLMVSVFTNYFFSFLASLPSLLILFSFPLLSKPMSPGDVKRWTSGHE